MELYTHQAKTYNYNIVRKHGSSSKKSGRVYKSNNKCFDIFCFDLENTNAWIDENGQVIPYEKGHNEEYWNSKQATSLVYIWQFSINDTVYYGRNLEDFLTVLEDLPKVNIVCFIHNLSHEFHFLTNILTPKDVFARSPHKPMKVIFKEFPHIEFRCSYIMTNLSLDDWGKQTGVYKKQKGLLDYDTLRTPLTPLSDDELKYCEYDLLVMYAGIRKELEFYKDVFDIPLTSTGKVRRIVKDLLFTDKNYSAYIKRLVPKIDEYYILKQCFAGGVCHCNRIHAGQTIEPENDIISHWDFCSSYPTVLISELYPVTRFHKCQKNYIRTDKTARKNYKFIYHVKFKNIKSINPNTYIQISKILCSTGKIINDNGRLVSCMGGKIEMFLTDEDFDIIQWLYTWEWLDVLECFYAKAGRLPRAFVDYILTLYEDKTRLKNVKGQENFYQRQKAFLNSLYGMCCTQIVPLDCQYIDGEWTLHTPTRSETIEKLKQLSDTDRKFNKDYFLSWSWGVFCTAYARKNLYKCILGLDDEGIKHEGTRDGYDVCYYDTDSLFIIGQPNFDWYNDEIDAKLKKACEDLNLDFERTRPEDIKGKRHPLGRFDREDDIIAGKFLHAKAYIEKREDNQLYLTVAGINKESVNLLKSVDEFDDGFVFDKDADCVHKLIPTYCYNQPVITYPDGYVSKYKYGKNLRRTGYKLSVTDEYKQLENAYKMSFGDLTFTQLTTFRNGV